MFDTLAQIGFAVALLLPGFLVVQLSERRRASTPAGGDLELVLRGLVYSLIIQAAAGLTGWLPHLVNEATEREWSHHISALAVYGLVVCVALPTGAGLFLGWVLRRAEVAGQLRWFHYALGARDARRAWDYVFGCSDGVWLRVFLKDPPPNGPPAILGKYGHSSWAARTPADPDLYLQEAWHTAADGTVSDADIDAGGFGGVWIDGEQIARVEFLR